MSDPLPLVGPTRQEALRRLAAPSDAGQAPKPRGAQGEPAPQALSDRLRAMFEAEGEGVVARRLGIDRGTLIRVIAGLPVRRGTIALVQEALAKEQVDHKSKTIPADRACLRCGAYTTTGYCSSRCARGGM